MDNKNVGAAQPGGISEDNWDKLLTSVLQRMRKIQETKEFKDLYNKISVDMKFFVNTIEQLKLQRRFKKIMAFFPKTETDIWDWMQKVVSGEATQRWEHFEEKASFGLLQHHLFLFVYELGGGLLILGAFYRLDSAKIYSSGCVASMCQAIASALGFGATAVIQGIDAGDWKLYFTALAAFMGIIELNSVNSWLKKEIDDNKFLDTSSNLIMAVMLDTMVAFVFDNSQQLKLPDKIKKAAKRYLIDDDDLKYYEENDSPKKKKEEL